jgi:glycosyltransferase involved in cell wall biosynthesis
MPKVLFIVEHESNSWGIAAKGCLKSLGCEGEVIGQVPFLTQTPDLKQYARIFNYMWRDENIMKKLLDQARGKVVNCIAAGPDMDSESLSLFANATSGFRDIGANTAKAVSILNSLSVDTRVHLLSHGVDTDTFFPKPVAHTGFRVGWIGRVKYPIKRFELAKKIVGGIPGAELVVASNKADPGGYPFYEYSDMPNFYNSIDVLLITSRSESHPLIVMEAMACGLPVLTTNVGDVESMILNGVTGHIVSTEATEDKYRLILNFLKNNPAHGRRMGALARATILQNWTWGKVNGAYKNLMGA